jgi:hypothetical protein
VTAHETIAEGISSRRHDLALRATNVRHDGSVLDRSGKLPARLCDLVHRRRQHDQVRLGRRAGLTRGNLVDRPSVQSSRYGARVDVVSHDRLAGPRGLQGQAEGPADESGPDNRHPGIHI